MGIIVKENSIELGEKQEATLYIQCDGEITIATGSCFYPDVILKDEIAVLIKALQTYKKSFKFTEKTYTFEQAVEKVGKGIDMEAYVPRQGRVTVTLSDWGNIIFSDEDGRMEFKAEFLKAEWKVDK